jgi:16S rRNA (guanine966-N2)-methyltransferase
MKMRIISGEFKSRLINVPDSKLIRPMTDRVRETLFNLFIIKLILKILKCLTFIQGQGALGLECLSRGAGVVHFVEKNPSIYNNLLKNINSFRANERCKVHKSEALKFIN